MVLQLCGGLDLYLVGKAAEPDATLEPRAHENWLINDAAVRTFIKTRCSSTELTFIEDCPTALSTWTTLQTHHQCQGMVSQIHLMQEAFTIKYSASTPFLDTSECLRTLNDHICYDFPLDSYPYSHAQHSVVEHNILQSCTAFRS